MLGSIRSKVLSTVRFHLSFVFSHDYCHLASIPVMYLRAAHAELYIPVLRQFIRDHPLGLLTTAIPSSEHQTLQTSHIPWVLDVQDDSSETELGRLRGHIARANPQTKAMIASFKDTPIIGGQSHQLTEDVLILFNGPADHYVTPKFYTTTKPDTGKVVPTWDYSAVQAYGKATIHFDTRSPQTSEYLQKQIEDLSEQSESAMLKYLGGGKTWKVADAPNSYVDVLKKAIIGIEIDITSLSGKFKMSQELAQGDREGVIKGFSEIDSPGAPQIAQMVKERGELIAKKAHK